MEQLEPQANSPMLDGGGWVLIRHVPAGSNWHPADDQLTGTSVYGDPSEGPQSLSAWSRKFDDVAFDEFLFATGDMTKWLIAARDQVIGDFYLGKRDIMKSSSSSYPYQATWVRRQGTPEDPWISLTDHVQAITSNDILYGENYCGGEHANVLSTNSGANVFIRQRPLQVTMPPEPASPNRFCRQRSGGSDSSQSQSHFAARLRQEVAAASSAGVQEQGAYTIEDEKRQCKDLDEYKQCDSSSAAFQGWNRACWWSSSEGLSAVTL